MTEATVSTASLKIGNISYDSVEDYIAAVHERISAKATSLSVVSPLAFLGFVPGKPLNFQLYEKMGFNHPKEHNYYNLTFDERGNPEGDPQMIAIYNGIKQRGEIDDPIIVYPIENSKDILVLDGATRASAIAYIMADDPEAFSRVPIKVFTGTSEEAMAEMVRRNLSDRNRPLADVELMRAIKRFVSLGWTKDEISDRLGQDRIKWRATLDNFIKVGESLIPDLVEAWQSGLITRSAAFEAAKTTQEEQETISESINSGEKVTGTQIKKKNVEKREMRYKKTLTTLSEKFSPESTGEKASQLAGFLAQNRLKSKYSERLTDIRDMIIRLRDDIAADLEPSKEE